MEEFHRSMRYITMIKNPEVENEMLDRIAKRTQTQGGDQNEVNYVKKQREFHVKLIKDLMLEGKSYSESCKQMFNDDEYLYEQHKKFYGPNYDYGCGEYQENKENIQNQQQKQDNNMSPVENQLLNDLDQFTSIINNIEYQSKNVNITRLQQNDIYLQQDNLEQISQQNLDFLQQFQIRNSEKDNFQQFDKQGQNSQQNSDNQQNNKQIFPQQRVIREDDIDLEQQVKNKQLKWKSIKEDSYSDIIDAMGDEMKYFLRSINKEQKQYVLQCIKDFSIDDFLGIKKKRKRQKKKK